MSVTVITLLKRKQEMSKADFIAYYETNHRRIGEQVLGGYATRYVRRFLFPLDGDDHDGDFDVVMEIDFPDTAARDAFFASVQGDQAVLDMITRDEEKLFDRPRIRTFSVEEHASTLPEVTL